jgi:predicted nucleic acid-binding protein
MTVLDTQAVIALMANEPAADEVESILRGREGIVSISAITIAEIMDVGVRKRGQRVDAMGDRVSALLAAGLVVVPVDEEVGRLAGTLRARHWDRDRRPVSLADCAVLATGMLSGEPIASSDAGLLAAARDEGHPVVPLADSQGRRPG